MNLNDNGNLIVAGMKARRACTCKSLAMNEMVSDADRDALLEEDAAHWAEAVNNLRLYGLGLPVDDPADQGLLVDDEDDELLDEPLDFKPLERSYKLSLVVKAVNRIIFISAVAGFAYLMGYGAGREAGAYPTAAQFQQQLQQLGGK